MDNLNITMEEYIRLEEEKARRHVIVFNDELSSEKTLFCEPTVSSLNNNEINFRISFDESDDEDHTISIRHMALLPRDQRHQYLRFEGLQYTHTDIVDFEERLGRIYDREGQSVFTSRAWRRLFKIRGPLVHELILEFFSTFRFGKEIESVRFDAYWAESARQILDKGDMSAYWITISSVVDFLGTTSSYTSIRGPMLRLCHRLITYNIVGSSQAPEKVFEGLTMIMRDLPVIDMAELVRLQICVELDDTWAWVAPGPERQQVAAAGTPEAAEDALVVD
ncbi:hypothetical protein Tco_0026039 [Tanacetum coccineum]